jgi:hypothetical protein
MFYRKNKYFLHSKNTLLKHYKTIVLITLFQFALSSIWANSYFVSTKGNNKNSGTINRPFYSVQFASKKLKPGDTLFIRGGNYSENCLLKIKGTKSNPIVIQNYQNEKVHFFPSSINLHWKKYSKHIYRAKIKRKIVQIFIHQKPVMQACYPNIIEGELTKNKWTNVFVTPSKQATFKLPKNKHFVNSTFIGICGRGTIAITGKVINQRKNKVILQNSDFYWDKKYKNAYLGKGKGYFVGNISFLDTLNEWFSDNNYLYWYGKPPKQHQVKFRTENDLFLLDHCEFVKIKGLNFFGKSVSLGHSKHCVLKHINCKYPTPFFQFEYSFDRFGSQSQSNPNNWSGKGLIINGSDNQLIHSSVSHSWGDGVTLYGSQNTLYNSVITNCNWMGTDAAAVNSSGKNNYIKHCFLAKCGRSVLLHRKLYQSKILYNEISEGGLLCDDLGLTYTYDTDGQGTEIAYNWVHHNRAPHYGSGIYLDNNHSNFKVHHNVVWKCFVAMTINQIALNDSIYNNTFIKNKYSMGSCWFSEYSPIIQNVITYNNLTDSDLKARDQLPFQGSIQYNNFFIPHLSNFLINPSENDFRINNSRLDTIQNRGAYTNNNKWKAGLVSPLPFDNEDFHLKSTNFSIQVINYILLVLLMLWCIYKGKNYQNLIINKYLLFTLTIISGIGYWFVYTSIFPNRETAELFKHFDDASLLFNQFYDKNTFAYFKFLVFGETTPHLNEILHQTNYWYFQTQPGNFGDNHLLIKLHGWLMPISRGNIFTHLLFFSFIAFQGMVFLFKLIGNFNISKTIFLFLIPSFWLFASSGTKDAIIFTAFSFLLYLLFSFSIKKPYHWIGIILSLYALYLLRPYLFLAFIPFIFIHLLELLIKKKLAFLYVCIIYAGILTLLLQVNQIHLFDTLQFKQQDLIYVSKEMHANTAFEISSLKNQSDLIKNTIESLYNVLFRPLSIQNENLGLLFISIENWLIIVIMIFSLIQFFRKKNKINSNLFFLCILTLLFIGWTIPISGVILRYRAIIFPFLFISLNSTQKPKNNEI